MSVTECEAGTRRLRDFLYECQTRDYGDATRRKMISIYENKGAMLRLEIAGMATKIPALRLSI